MYIMHLLKSVKKPEPFSEHLSRVITSTCVFLNLKTLTGHAMWHSAHKDDNVLAKRRDCIESNPTPDKLELCFFSFYISVCVV